MSKLFKNWEEQIDLLKERGLKIINEEKFKWYIRNYNYQNLINGYNDFFMINNNRKTNYYKKNIDSEMIINLFNFDRQLVSIILSDLLNIERKFSTMLAYEIMNNYLAEIPILKSGEILKCNNYEMQYIFPNINKIDLTLSGEKNLRIEKNIDILKEILCAYSKNKTTTLKYKNLNEIPLWTLSLNWTFSQTCKLYSLLDKKIQKNISNHFCKKKERNFYINFEKVMILFNDIRNIVCHNNVLYKIDYKKNTKNISNMYNFLFLENIKNIRLKNIINLIITFTPHKSETLNIIENKINELSKRGFDEETLDFIKKYTNFKK
ncbi:MAG: Abi family protein [Metamycoplasmataceae bacterium]